MTLLLESDLLIFLLLLIVPIGPLVLIGFIVIGLIEFSKILFSILSILWLLFLSNLAIKFYILLLSSPFFFFYTFLLSTDPLVKLVFIINKLLLGDMLLSFFSIIFEDFCLYSVENILFEISGSRARWMGTFFIFIFTKLNDCPDCANYLIENKLGFDFGVVIAPFRFGFVILKLLVSFFSSGSLQI